MNPYRVGTWSYEMWQEGFDNPGAEPPYTKDEHGHYENEFGVEMFRDGQLARMHYEQRGMV